APWVARPGRVRVPPVGFPLAVAPGAGGQAEVAGRRPELAVQVLPLTDPQGVQVLALAHPAEGRRRQLALLFAQVVPQMQDGQEVRAGLGEPRVLGVRRLPGISRALPYVLHRQCGGDDQYLADAAVPARLDDHAADPRVDRQVGQLTADLAQPPPVVAGPARRVGPELLQQPDAVGHVALIRRVDKREVGHLAQVQGGHTQYDRGQVGAQDLRVGEPRPRLEVLLAVQPDTDAVRGAPAPALALVGRGL